jgi:hypothetical protein
MKRILPPLEHAERGSKRSSGTSVTATFDERPRIAQPSPCIQIGRAIARVPVACSGSVGTERWRPFARLRDVSCSTVNDPDLPGEAARPPTRYLCRATQ